MRRGYFGELSGPVRRQRHEHPALARDRLGHHDVERRHPVGGDEEEAFLVDLVDVADFARSRCASSRTTVASGPAWGPTRRTEPTRGPRNCFGHRPR